MGRGTSESIFWTPTYANTKFARWPNWVRGNCLQGRLSLPNPKDKPRGLKKIGDPTTHANIVCLDKNADGERLTFF